MDIDKLPKSKLPMPWGEFSVIGFEDHNGEEHLAIYLGDVSENPLLRIHSQCLTGDALFSLRCDCGPQLAMALEKIASEIICEILLQLFSDPVKAPVLNFVFNNFC